jgi:exonuclease VII small subunit
MIRQAGLDLERVMHRIREGGLDLDDAQAAWERAMGHADEGITRGVREIRQARPSI